MSIHHLCVLGQLANSTRFWYNRQFIPMVISSRRGRSGCHSHAIHYSSFSGTSRVWMDNTQEKVERYLPGTPLRPAQSISTKTSLFISRDNKDHSQTQPSSRSQSYWVQSKCAQEKEDLWVTSVRMSNSSKKTPLQGRKSPASWKWWWRTEVGHSLCSHTSRNPTWHMEWCVVVEWLSNGDGPQWGTLRDRKRCFKANISIKIEGIVPHNQRLKKGEFW